MGIEQVAEDARDASILLAAAKTELKNQALAAIAAAIKANTGRIIAANREDLAASEKDKLAKPLLKRLAFNEEKIADVTAGIESLINLADPVGVTLKATELDNGLELYRVSCPIGVIGIVFESRPDALVQINKILAEVITAAGKEASLPDGWLHLLERRSDVAEMLTLDENIDLLIPRGSNEFVRYIMDNTNIPVLGHAEGLCHVYVDADADLEMAVKIAVDSKCQYVAVCNAAETLLVHEKVAGEFLPKVRAALEQKGVQLRGCSRTTAVIDVRAATEADWSSEYLDYILSIKVVPDADSAVEHINRYGSGHTDAIVTNNRGTAGRFMQLVDSGNVFHNCSTRFSDGFRYGLGAEVGISTGKIHARGPVGLEGLVIYKYKLLGTGQVVADAGKFTHKELDKECAL